MIKRIASQPDLELVGLHCYTEETVGVLASHGMFPDADPYVKVLEAGINIVATADWITGDHRNLNHPHASGKSTTQILEQACLNGGSTYHSAESWRMCEYGLPVEDPQIAEMLDIGTRVFADGVYLMADCFGLKLDAVTFSYELGSCTEGRHPVARIRRAVQDIVPSFP
jgi:4-hydroxy-tetrahydrodipicolinate reductase